MLRTALRNVLAHKARLVMTVLAVCLGVAFVSGTLVFADTVHRRPTAPPRRRLRGHRRHRDARRTPAGDRRQGAARGARRRPRTRARHRARRRVRTPCRSDGTATLARQGRPPAAGRQGAGRISAAAYVPGADGKDSRYPLTEGRAPASQDEIALDRGTARRRPARARRHGHARHRRPGHSPSGWSASSPPTTAAVTAGGTLALFDRATAQQLFPPPGPTPGSTCRRRARHQPVRTLATGRRRAPRRPGRGHHRRRAGRSAGHLRRYQDQRVHELPDSVFARVSLFIGTFLIVNTFTMVMPGAPGRSRCCARSVPPAARWSAPSWPRPPWSALPRRRPVSRSGLGIATVAARRPDTAADPLPDGPLVIGPHAVVAALVVGVGVTVLAAWLPSRGRRRSRPSRRCAVPTSRPPRPCPGCAAPSAWHCSSLARDSSSRSPARRTPPDANLRTAMFGCAALVVADDRPRAPARRSRDPRCRPAHHALRGRRPPRPRERPARPAANRGHRCRASDQYGARRRARRHRPLHRPGPRPPGRGRPQCRLRDQHPHLHDRHRRGCRTACRRSAGVRTASAVADSTLFTGGNPADLRRRPRHRGGAMKLRFLSGSLTDLGPGRIAISSTTAREHGLAGRHDQRGHRPRPRPSRTRSSASTRTTPSPTTRWAPEVRYSRTPTCPTPCSASWCGPTAAPSQRHREPAAHRRGQQPAAEGPGPQGARP